MKLWHLLILASLVTACRPTAKVPASLVVRDSAGVIIVEHPLNALATTRQLSLGDTIAPYVEGVDDFPGTGVFARGVLFGKEHQLLMLDLRDQRVMAYDTAGQLVKVAGRKGAGPEEFNGASEMHWIAPDTLMIMDLSNGRVALLDADLNFLTTELPGGTGPRQMGSVLAREADGTMLAMTYDERGSRSDPGPIHRDHMLLVRLHPHGKIDTVASHRLGEQYANSPSAGGDTKNSGPEYYEFGKESSATPWQNMIVVAESNGRTFEVRNAAGVLVRRVVLHEGSRPVIGEMRDSTRARELRRAFSNHTRPANDPIIANWIARIKRMQFADSLPPYEDFIAGRDGRLWVGEYVGPLDSLRYYAVFSEAGKLAGRLAVPVKQRLLAADTDRVVLRQLDADGVGHLEVRRLGSLKSDP